jgi:hypothetical protein
MQVVLVFLALLVQLHEQAVEVEALEALVQQEVLELAVLVVLHNLFLLLAQPLVLAAGVVVLDILLAALEEPMLEEALILQLLTLLFLLQPQ